MLSSGLWNANDKDACKGIVASGHKRYFITFGRAINSMLTWFGDEFSHRAKSWLKGKPPDEMEEQTRNIRAVNLIGRY